HKKNLFTLSTIIKSLTTVKVTSRYISTKFTSNTNPSKAYQKILIFSFSGKFALFESLALLRTFIEWWLEFSALLLELLALLREFPALSREFPALLLELIKSI